MKDLADASTGVDMPNRTIEIPIPPKTIPEARIITARSHFIDRFSADCETIILPGRDMPGGTLYLDDGEITAEASERKPRVFERLLQKPHVAAPEGRWIFDMRMRTPSNWAHFLNNHLPTFFKAAEATGRDPDKACLLLPSDIPGYILNAAALFELEVLRTDARIIGDGVAAEPKPVTAPRAARAEWAKTAFVRERLEAGIARQSPPATPERVFLARRDSRRLSNMEEIERLLAAKGFTTVFAEDLTPAGQFRLFREASQIVAIHGAALAPLLFCSDDARPASLIELMPVGHMTDVFRAIAAEVGTFWIGVRGKIKANYVEPAYDLNAPFKAFSLDDFEVDPVSLECAIEISGI